VDRHESRRSSRRREDSQSINLYIAMRFVEGETLAKKIAAARAGSAVLAKASSRGGRPVALPCNDGTPAEPSTSPSTGRRSIERILALVAHVEPGRERDASGYRSFAAVLSPGNQRNEAKEHQFAGESRQGRTRRASKTDLPSRADPRYDAVHPSDPP
jgi:hypothetical protein